MNEKICQIIDPTHEFYGTSGLARVQNDGNYSLQLDATRRIQHIMPSQLKEVV